LASQRKDMLIEIEVDDTKVNLQEILKQLIGK